MLDFRDFFFFCKTITNRLTKKENNHSHCLQLFDVHCTSIDLFLGRCSGSVDPFQKDIAKHLLKRHVVASFDFPSENSNSYLHQKCLHPLQDSNPEVNPTGRHHKCTFPFGFSVTKTSKHFQFFHYGVLFDTHGDTYLVDTFHHFLLVQN